MTENAGAPEGTPEAPETPGTPATPDEATTLRSRNAGLDAKVTSLSGSLKEVTARAEAAEKRALELAEGKENGDAELRAQLESFRTAAVAAERKAALADIKATYPESFAVLGDAVASLTADQLAANEARLAGVGAGETPNPVGNNPSRGTAPAQKAIEDMSVAELEAHLKNSFDPSVFFKARGND